METGLAHRKVVVFFSGQYPNDVEQELRSALSSWQSATFVGEKDDDGTLFLAKVPTARETLHIWFAQFEDAFRTTTPQVLLTGASNVYVVVESGNLISAIDYAEVLGSVSFVAFGANPTWDDDDPDLLHELADEDVPNPTVFASVSDFVRSMFSV